MRDRRHRASNPCPCIDQCARASPARARVCVCVCVCGGGAASRPVLARALQGGLAAHDAVALKAVSTGLDRQIVQYVQDGFGIHRSGRPQDEAGWDTMVDALQSTLGDLLSQQRVRPTSTANTLMWHAPGSRPCPWC